MSIIMLSCEDFGYLVIVVFYAYGIERTSSMLGIIFVSENCYCTSHLQFFPSPCAVSDILQTSINLVTATFQHSLRDCPYSRNRLTFVDYDTKRKYNPMQLSNYAR
ncbi:hypothetical protein BDF20DRAFT_990261 [Mycotypha africana]|uniref:uncharacterized protein n=1 Tax=Mycotypha africana TaxID=64632 RepID=UPI0023012CEE|nr:uncharacterized protein BDF20DRAFT_990261 [Mycotypha africana]KAI8969911.1 hypothetical protein BDF20DRAFT_990261 [Mycotypha africana]